MLCDALHHPNAKSGAGPPERLRQRLGHVNRAVLGSASWGRAALHPQCCCCACLSQLAAFPMVPPHAYPPPLLFPAQRGSRWKDPVLQTAAGRCVRGRPAAAAAAGRVPAAAGSPGCPRGVGCPHQIHCQRGRAPAGAQGWGGACLLFAVGVGAEGGVLWASAMG